MSQDLQLCPERLYLSKEPLVYVDLVNLLEQHHIDGVRFLYRQFKKKNPGVILNDPIGYSHNLQVVLFVNAIRTLTDGAVLILCHHSNLSDWTEYFQKWTNISDDLAIDVSNPFLKKSVFISPIDKLDKFCRRNWAIAVVDHDDFLRNKQNSSQLNADYKIFITPYDMKENLDKFSAIFKWFHPKGQLNVEEFRPNTNNLRDVIAKSIIFQAFVEDIVLRRNIIFAQPDTYKIPLSPVTRVTKKNKDATGTKIKRSKRKADDSKEVQSVNSKIRCEIDLAGSRYHIASRYSSDLHVSDINDVSNDQCNVDSAMDVETFIRSREPIQSDAFTDCITDFDDNMSRSSPKIEEEDFKNNNEVDVTNEKGDEFVSISYDLSVKDDDEKADNTENMQLHYSEDVSQNLTSDMKNDDQLLPQSHKVGNEIENGSSAVKMGVEIETNKVNPDSETSNTMNDIAIDSTEHETKTKNSLNEDVKSELENEVFVNKESGDNLKVTTNGKDLDDKLKELEEKALLKFKGSLLDRIF